MSDEIRYRGDSIRNPIFVLRDADIPRTFSYEEKNGIDRDGKTHETLIRTFSENPSIKYYPQSEEFSDVPETIIIDKTDLDFLLPEQVVPEEILAYFEIKSIRIALSADFVSSYWKDNTVSELAKAKQSTPISLRNGMSYYFVGEIKQANYCSAIQPFINYYTMDSERPLELYLSGDQLTNVSKVIFTFPNGIVKEAEIIEGDTFGTSGPIIYPNQVYRLENAEAARDPITAWFQQNAAFLSVLSYIGGGEIFFNTAPGESEKFPWKITSEKIDDMLNFELDLNKFRLIKNVFAYEWSLNNEYSLYSYTGDAQPIWIAILSTTAEQYGLVTGKMVF